MSIKDALPDRKVRIELHVMDKTGKTLNTIESDNRNIDFINMFGSMEYDYMIPLSKRYIFYVREAD